MPLFKVDENGTPVRFKFESKRKMKTERDALSSAYDMLLARYHDCETKLQMSERYAWQQSNDMQALRAELRLEKQAHQWRTKERDILLAGGEIGTQIEQTAFAELLHEVLVKKIEALEFELECEHAKLSGVLTAGEQIRDSNIKRHRQFTFLLAACMEADEKRAPEGRTGRLGTAKIREILGVEL